MQEGTVCNTVGFSHQVRPWTFATTSENGPLAPGSGRPFSWYQLSDLCRLYFRCFRIACWFCADTRTAGSALGWMPTLRSMRARRVLYS